MHPLKKELTAVNDVNQKRCDACGDYYDTSNSFHPTSIHAEHAFGYESTLVEDMAQQNMNICEKCLYDWVKSHGLYPSVIPPSDDKK